jgi:hypothetical protein
MACSKDYKRLQPKVSRRTKEMGSKTIALYALFRVSNTGRGCLFHPQRVCFPVSTGLLLDERTGWEFACSTHNDFAFPYVRDSSSTVK